MRAVVLDQFGGPEVLKIRTLPDLVPGPSQVRVATVATALNRADLLERRGKYPPPGPKSECEIPGMEFAGTVDVTGPGVTEWRVGDRVFGLLAAGGYADQVVAHERLVLRIPDGMGFADAAAIPEVFFTAWDALTTQGGLRSGDAVLIHAAGSGVGTAAIQLARLFGAARIFGTTRSPAKARMVEQLGPDRVILSTEEDFDRVVHSETGNRGADVILDFVGEPYLEKNLRAAAIEGRIVLISALGGPHGVLPISMMLEKRLRLVGTSLRGRPLEQKMLLTQRFAREILPHFTIGRLRPVIDRTFPFEEVAEAHRFMEENRNFGKIVLTVQHP